MTTASACCRLRSRGARDAFTAHADGVPLKDGSLSHPLSWWRLRESCLLKAFAQNWQRCTGGLLECCVSQWRLRSWARENVLSHLLQGNRSISLGETVCGPCVEEEEGRRLWRLKPSCSFVLVAPLCVWPGACVCRGE